MNLGSMIEREEKRFVYPVRCSSDDNNEEEEMEYPEPRSAVGFYSKNPCASSMVPPFERLIRNFNQLK